jgi:hypothetical protein
MHHANHSTKKDEGLDLRGLQRCLPQLANNKITTKAYARSDNTAPPRCIDDNLQTGQSTAGLAINSLRAGSSSDKPVREPCGLKKGDTHALKIKGES